MTGLYAKEGGYVEGGQLVAKIDDGGLLQQIAQQQVQLDLAKTTYEKQKRLWEKNIGAEIQYLEAKGNYEVLQNAVASAKQQLAKTNVYAPFSGFVEEIITEQGQVVMPGASPLFRLINLNTMYVAAEVPEKYLSTIQKGTQTHVAFQSIDRKYTSAVSRVNHTINPNNRTYKIEIPLKGRTQLIKPNLIADLKIKDYANPNAIIVPNTAIQENAAGEQFVFVVGELNQKNETTVTRKLITPGFELDGMVEVLKGLEKGDEIVLEGAKNLREGAEVAVFRPSTSENF